MTKIITKICNIVGTIILIAIVLVAGTVLGLQLFGYAPMAAETPSMEPNYHVGDLIFCDTNVKPEDVALEDVITYRYIQRNGKEDIITHRVVEIDAEAREFTTKGDNNRRPDQTPVPFENMIGRAWYRVPISGAGFFLRDLRTVKGLAWGAILLGVLVALFAIPTLFAKANEAPPPEEMTVEQAKAILEAAEKAAAEKNAEEPENGEPETTVTGDTEEELDDFITEMHDLIGDTKPTANDEE